VALPQNLEVLTSVAKQPCSKHFVPTKGLGNKMGSKFCGKATKPGFYEA